jgi:hypothetical protein
MKLFLALLLASPFAFAFRGGHEGNGGHICWDSAMGRSSSLEELRFPLRNEDQRPPVDLSGRLAFESVQLDLGQPMIQAIESKYRLMAAEQPKLAALLSDALASFNDVYVLRRKILRGGRGAGNVNAMACPPPLEVRPVVLTFYNGGVVFLEKTWAQLSATTQQIILIHETLRVLQMLHPMMAELRNDELERLTVEIYRKSTRLEGSQASLLEKTLATASLPPYSGPTYEEALRRKELDAALRAKIHVVLTAGESLSEAMNAVRSDEVFTALQQRELRNTLTR